MRKWLVVHRSAILVTIVALQNLPGLSTKLKEILGTASFILGG